MFEDENEEEVIYALKPSTHHLSLSLSLSLLSQT